MSWINALSRCNSFSEAMNVLDQQGFREDIEFDDIAEKVHGSISETSRQIYQPILKKLISLKLNEIISDKQSFYIRILDCIIEEMAYRSCMSNKLNLEEALLAKENLIKNITKTISDEKLSLMRRFISEINKHMVQVEEKIREHNNAYRNYFSGKPIASVRPDFSSLKDKEDLSLDDMRQAIKEARDYLKAAPNGSVLYKTNTSLELIEKTLGIEKNYLENVTHAVTGIVNRLNPFH